MGLCAPGKAREAPRGCARRVPEDTKRVRTTFAARATCERLKPRRTRVSLR